MNRFYKAANHRLIARSGNGRFRQTTLEDIGIKVTVCPKCGQINVWKRPSDGKPDPRLTGGFIDPGDMELQKPTVCNNCGTDLRG
jgi:ribosomal protein L32